MNALNDSETGLFPMITASAVAVFLLFPILFLPITPDLASFICGGKVIASGGLIYKDFLDIKPPMVYYLFAGIVTVFGTSDFSVRLFDFFWHSATVLSLMWIVRRLTGNSQWAFCSGLLYSLVYAGCNYINAMQTESFIALPLFWAIYLQVTKNKTTILKSLLIGLLIGFITSFKYSFILILPAFLICDIFNKEFDIKKKLLHVLIISLFSFLFFSLTMPPLLNSEVRKGFFSILSFYSYYQDLTVIGEGLIIAMLKSFSMFAAEYLSITVLVCMFIGLYVIAKMENQVDNNLYDRKHKLEVKKLTQIVLLTSILLFFSVVIERKVFCYHVFRMVWLPLVLAGAGLSEFIRIIKLNMQNSKIGGKVFVIIIIAFLLMFSPLSRWLFVAQNTYLYLTDKHKYSEKYELPEDFSMFRIQQERIAADIKANIIPTDKVCVIANQSNIIYLLAGAERISRFAHSSFYFGLQSPQEWKTGIEDEIRQSQWIVLQHNIANPYFNGHSLTNLEMIEKNYELNRYFKDSLTVIDSTKNFILFKKYN
jgi:hypothetical protein